MELLWQCPRRKTLVDWPEDVDTRLDVLVRAAAAAGEQTSRSQVLAALVTAAEVRPAVISELLHSYRQMQADALEADNTRADLPSVRSPGRTRGRR
ncbi:MULTISPECIES: hypothetical protein [Streptomyces]|uniref:Uncharacterized protein n=2 Tax=Streptomyces avermitilis TaxID=33903 RepID=Q82RC1_STRAW|nr:hypothetical protein [Streptomyces avermitilis]MYS95930.1 hypothetical protein [Streptomyces sp. SID5469]BAC67931.1 hypothetical protein SAVERM_222 [Streptomyces avermitilis MA-4680 = NBRC 14893]BBJ47635.1 hypothetical protein SAVMC3_02640 [Streptomyces avermitilis]GDY69987.1 hypothetical protein SAV14893_093800 [Streptomyces avermitilis]GDY80253.1 hypothetical protein SAV31267_097380 [Streptomyces avermitilis]